jgi:hypothetical protein
MIANSLKFLEKGNCSIDFLSTVVVVEVFDLSVMEVLCAEQKITDNENNWSRNKFFLYIAVVLGVKGV